MKRPVPHPPRNISTTRIVPSPSPPLMFSTAAPGKRLLNGPGAQAVRKTVDKDLCCREATGKPPGARGKRNEIEREGAGRQLFWLPAICSFNRPILHTRRDPFFGKGSTWFSAFRFDGMVCNPISCTLLPPPSHSLSPSRPFLSLFLCLSTPILSSFFLKGCPPPRSLCAS